MSNKWKKVGVTLLRLMVAIGLGFMVARAWTGTRIGESFTRPELCDTCEKGESENE